MGFPEEVLTPDGAVRLIPIPSELFRRARSLLPFGVIRFPELWNDANFGIVMKCGDVEVELVKSQPPDSDAKSGGVLHRLQCVLIAYTLADYQREGFSGLMLPIPYERTKAGDRKESGIAYFAAPDPGGREVESMADGPRVPMFDDKFGQGFTRMMVAFEVKVHENAKELAVPLPQIIGVEIRKRLALGSVVLDFMTLGPAIICLKRRISDRDPAWGMLRTRGVSEVFHMPSVPIEIEDSALPEAKDIP